jgi:AICAR transformylase/IMP cyclohydrolase PurH
VKTIEIRGVWLLKATAHNGNRLEVVVELADGSQRLAIAEVADDGPISHYVHPAGIVNAPAWERLG